MILKASRGSPLELGARLEGSGANFAVYSGSASAMSLVLFDKPGDRRPAREIKFSPEENRTGDVWHLFVEGVSEGALYGFRADGSRLIRDGHRFNPANILLDPYARAVADLQSLPKCVLTRIDDFDWQGVRKPKIPWEKTVIYETHVKGFTAHPSSKVKYPGTYCGVIEKIPYLKDLGITAVEFLPLQEFNHRENPRRNPLTEEVLGNYWGYSTVAFFAPKGSYSSSGDTGEQVVEFKEMVRELHRAGIEVILDIVFNHTAEMGRGGPTYSFRGLDNRAYYLMAEDGRRYLNLTGCGNTFKCSHPAVVDFIVHCLRYWSAVMMVDGFRFDLATIFNRDEKGGWLEDSPVLKRINGDPLLKGVKLISEPWDAAGGYKPGSFGGREWVDWNDRCRDDVRRFWRGDSGSAGRLATRVAGSQDLFAGKGTPLKSLNFITCHDGFTLYDLCSYTKKHNIANGHRNRDGMGENFSRNFGAEGETEDPEILHARLRQAKNFIATLFLSQGIPMILGGDEFLRTQGGNNNAYCQDNDVSWFNWELLAGNREIHRFCREMIKLRRSKPFLKRRNFFTGQALKKNIRPDVLWFKDDGTPQDWGKSRNTLGCFINGRWRASGRGADDDFFLMFNSGEEAVKFKLPPGKPVKEWYVAVDTDAESPHDIFPPGDEPLAESQAEFTIGPLSLSVLVGK